MTAAVATITCQKSNSKHSSKRSKATQASRRSSKQLLILMLWFLLPKKQDLAFLLPTWRRLNQNLVKKNWKAWLVDFLTRVFGHVLRLSALAGVVNPVLHCASLVHWPAENGTVLYSIGEGVYS